MPNFLHLFPVEGWGSARIIVEIGQELTYLKSYTLWGKKNCTVLFLQ